MTPEHEARETTYVDAIREAIAEEMERDERVFVLGEDIGVYGGAFKVTDGLLAKFGEERVMDTPLSEAAIVGAAVGSAMSGLFEKIGLSFDEVHSGEHSLLWSPTRDFTESEKERFDAWLDRIYDDFTSKVAASRRMPKEKVLEIARGRIWTGEDAVKNGLVDELGGFETAVRLAKKAGNIPASETVDLEVYPRPKTLFETVRARMFGRNDLDEPDASEPGAATAAAIRAIRPIARRLHALGLDGANRGVLTMPEIRSAD